MKSLLSTLFLYFCFILFAACNDEQNYNNDPTEDELAFDAVTVVEGLDVPWGMTWLPDGRMLVTERPGAIKIIENGEIVASVGNIPEVYNRNQGGLLDIQLHPDYENNGWIYFSYSKPGEDGASTAIMRAKLDGTALTDKELIFESFPKTNSGIHFGSRMDFDENGFLFFSVGERGKMDNAQTVGNPFGKIHRLYDNGEIPESNPFTPIPDASHSIWSYGHRNPQGLQFHPVTGELWAHEHGPKGGDELNKIIKSKNYGWPEITYGIDYDGTIISNKTQEEGMMQPVHYWDPSIAPCGMTFVSSDRYPEWKNNVLIGSLKFQYLCRVVLDENGNYLREEKLLENIGRVRHIAEGPDGYIYVAVEGPGSIIKLVPKS